MSNREFRKVPSLKFLYEVSGDGRVLRNVKSKKQARVFAAAGGYVADVRVAGRARRVAMGDVVAECWLGPRPEGATLARVDGDPGNDVWENLRYERVAVVKRPVTLVLGDGTRADFESQTAAAKYLAERVGQTPEHVKAKFRRRRSSVYGCTVVYG